MPLWKYFIKWQRRCWIASIIVPVRIQTSPTPQTCNYEVSDARRTLCKYYKVPFIPCDVQFDDNEHIRRHVGVPEEESQYLTQDTIGRPKIDMYLIIIHILLRKFWKNKQMNNSHVKNITFSRKDARERAICTKLSRSNKIDFFHTFEVRWTICT